MKFLADYGLQVLLLLLMLGLTLWGFAHLPAQVPVHWNINGQADRMGSRAELLLMPWFFAVVAAGLEALVYVARKKSQRQMVRIVSTGTLLFGVYALYSGIFPDGSLHMLLILGAMFMLMGNLMGRMEPNLWVGLRTPWTYLSRRAWYASQRRSGYAFMVLGALACGVGLLPLPLAGYLTLGWTGLTFLVVAYLVYASYRDYRADPDPQLVRLN